MSVRTQITLSELQYSRLKLDAKRQKRSLADLVRSAVNKTYGYPADDDGFEAAVDACSGMWAGQIADSDQYSAKTRPPRPTLHSS